MSRLLLNNVSSIRSGATCTLAAGDTTAVWSTDPGFPTVTSPDYLPVTVEPGSVNEEIIYVTAHIAGATSSTVVRNSEAVQNGVGAIAHSSAVWGHNATAQDGSFTGAVSGETARAEAAEALLAPKESPAFTGTPTAPTPAALDASTKLATTAYADAATAVEKSRALAAEGTNTNAITTETTRATTAEALLAPKASPAFTGTPTAPTPASLDASTKLATTAYADAAVLVEKSRALAAEALALLKANNLSDLADAGSSRYNLHIGIETGVKCVAVANVALSGLQTVDGYTLLNSDIILLTAQTTASQNGLWQAPASGTGAWARPTQFPAGGTIGSARKVVVSGGTTYKGTDWVLQTTTTITIDTTAQTWMNTVPPSGTFLVSGTPAPIHGAPDLYIQNAAPSSPKVGDIWLQVTTSEQPT